MIRKTLLALGACIALAGCATDPEQFSNSVNNAVTDVHTSTVAAVSIGTDVLSALTALAPAILNLLGEL